MNETIEKDLIHPITRGTYKEPVYKDFVSREEFINQTGIFVSPDYYEYIYDVEYKKSGVSVEKFVRDYEEKYSTCIQEIPLQGVFKYEVMDDELNCAGEYDECYEPNIWEIINSLARNGKAEFEKRYDAIEKYNSVLERCQKFPDEFLVLIEIIKKVWLQNNIVNDLLGHLAYNEVCATEIVRNEALKDVWDISLNQLKMISNDLGIDIDSFKQVEQSDKKESRQS